VAEFDPSVSPKLSPSVILARCSVPFSWRLGEAEWGGTFSPAQTRDWVFDAVEQGAPAIRTGIWRSNCTETGRANIAAFVQAAQTVEGLLAEGHPRGGIREAARRLREGA